MPQHRRARASLPTVGRGRRPPQSRRPAPEVGKIDVRISPEQVKAARSLLKWPLSELARKVDASAKVLEKFERGRRQPTVLLLSTIRHVLEDAGIEFTESEPGVRLRGKSGVIRATWDPPPERGKP